MCEGTTPTEKELSMIRKPSSGNLKKQDSSADDGFKARRSTKVTGPSTADGDTWQETLAGEYDWPYMR